MGAEIAHREGQPLVPGTPGTAIERRDELRVLARSLKVVQRLTTYGLTVQVLEGRSVRQDQRHYLLDLDIPAGQLMVSTYPNSAAAEAAYGVLESEAGPDRDVVLVAVSSMAALRRAYPNYFLDTTTFVDLVRDVVKSPRR